MSSAVLQSTFGGLAVLTFAACAPPLPASISQPDAGGAGPDASPTDVPSDASYNGMLNLGGDITGVHDPVILASETHYYVYSTGDGIEIRESTDLMSWRRTGQVFASKPEWITTTDHGSNALWAPDLSFFGGQYHLYYAASSFGSNNSCIGHATSASLDTPVWVDRGAVICSTSSDNWNAIDPAAIVDESGSAWLSLGSFWAGLKLIKLDLSGARDGTSLVELATRSNTAVEAPYIVRRNGYYYLFESVDHCCQGAASDYKIMIGRSTDIAGPYVDQSGRDLADGGGSLVLSGGLRWKGPGHNAILRTAGGDYNIYHSYDGDGGGIPTLRIAELHWTNDEWPLSAGP